MRGVLTAATFVGLVPGMVAGQTPTTKTTKQIIAACRVPASAPWIAKQSAWFAEPAHDWTDDTLRTALLKAAGLTAPLGSPAQLGYVVRDRPLPDNADAAAMAQSLLKLAAARGSTWPTKSVVGAAGAHAVFVLAQRDTALGRAALHRMMEAGPNESAAADVATLEDFLRLTWGRKQIYGTQFTTGNSGKLQLAPMEDSTHADLRREDAALPPLKTGICLANAGK
jgi:hypothetical protein